MNVHIVTYIASYVIKLLQLGGLFRHVVVTKLNIVSSSYRWVEIVSAFELFRSNKSEDCDSPYFNRLALLYIGPFCKESSVYQS